MEPAEPSRTFLADTKSGDTRKALEALRDRLAAELDGKSGTGVAALAAQLLLVLRELSPDQPATSLEDELRKRRARRTGEPDGPDPVKRNAGRPRHQKTSNYPIPETVGKGASRT